METELELAEAAFKRGKAAIMNENQEVGIDEYTEAIKHDPTDARFYFHRSLAFSNTKENEKALADVNQYIELEDHIKNLSVGFELKAQVLGGMFKLSQAKSAYEKCLELDPSNAGAKDFLELHSYQLETPLYFFSKYGALEVVQKLARAEPETINQESDDDQEGGRITPLCIASNFGYTDVVKCLLEARAEVDQKGIEGFTALHIASQRGHVGTVQCLINGKAYINEESLLVAVVKGHMEVVQCLVNGKANINQKMLDCAVVYGHPLITLFLVLHGPLHLDSLGPYMPNNTRDIAQAIHFHGFASPAFLRQETRQALIFLEGRLSMALIDLVSEYALITPMEALQACLDGQMPLPSAIHGGECTEAQENKLKSYLKMLGHIGPRKPIVGWSAVEGLPTHLFKVHEIRQQPFYLQEVYYLSDRHGSYYLGRTLGEDDDYFGMDRWKKYNHDEVNIFHIADIYDNENARQAVSAEFPELAFQTTAKGLKTPYMRGSEEEKMRERKRAEQEERERVSASLPRGECTVAQSEKLKKFLGTLRAKPPERVDAETVRGLPTHIFKVYMGEDWSRNEAFYWHIEDKQSSYYLGESTHISENRWYKYSGDEVNVFHIAVIWGNADTREAVLAEFPEMALQTTGKGKRVNT